MNIQRRTEVSPRIALLCSPEESLDEPAVRLQARERTPPRAGSLPGGHRLTPALHSQPRPFPQKSCRQTALPPPRECPQAPRGRLRPCPGLTPARRGARLPRQQPPGPAASGGCAPESARKAPQPAPAQTGSLPPWRRCSAPGPPAGGGRRRRRGRAREALLEERGREAGGRGCWGPAGETARPGFPGNRPPPLPQ